MEKPSRIIVKNLPPYTDNEALKKHFSQKGKVTDVKLMRTTTGKSRRFAFLGFQNASMANDSAEYFNNSFIDTFKITVELAKAAGDVSLPKAWRMINREESNDNKEEPVEQVAPAPSTAIPKSQDDKFQEYLDVMKPRVKAKSWANDGSVTMLENAAPSSTAQEAVDQDMNEVNAMASESSSSDARQEEIVPIPEASNDDSAIARDERLSDMDYLRARMKRRLAGDSRPIEQPEPSSEEQETESTAGTKRKADEMDQESAKAEQILDNGRLFVRNLPYDCTEEQLKETFEHFGPVAEVHLPIDKMSRSQKGFAYVSYMLPEHAVKAYLKLDGKSFQGRLLHILPAAEKPAESTFEPSTSAVKLQKEAKKKSLAGNSFNWNSLFMSQNAVASSIAARLGVDKSAIFDPAASDAAVRLAQAETHLITETKKYLEENGINVSSFGKKERSETVILVKNIPFGTTKEELEELFGKHGPLGRILIPPAGTLAVVEFLTPAEARSAFKALAYRRFKDAPIYLEKAPVGVLNPATAISANATNSVPATEATVTAEPIQAKPKHAELESATTPVDDDDLDSADTVSLFVKNLNFGTNEEKLRKAFENVEGFRSATIKTKNDPKHPGQKLSMGFGFIEFKTRQQAQNVVKAMQGFTLDGHALELKLSNRGQVNANERAKFTSQAADESSTKIAVKNIPFEASRSDIRGLFEAFGKIKSVRTPRKFDHSTRGFAFLEFATHKEAKNVLETMQNTHLLGRRLVLEWAEESESLGKLRDKARKEYSKDSGLPGQKKRLRINMNGDEEEEA